LLSPEFGLDLRQIVAAAGKRKLEDKILDAIGGERADKLRALTGRGGPTPAETPAGAASPPAAEGTPAPGAAAAQPPAAAAPPATGAATSATGEATPATGAATPALAIEVTRSRLSGNFLRPDLRVEGSFVGPGIDHADLTVTGRDGRVLHEKQRAFPEIDAYFAGRDRREVATIPFFIKVERLTLAVGGVQVTIVLHATDGTRVERTVSADR
jgi:hypothetical protein